MADPDEMEVAFTNHRTFYAIAYRYSLLVSQLVKERDKRTPITTDEEVDFICLMNARIQREAMVVVIFSALTLEAFINDYGLENFSRSYFDKHLDKLSPVSKWLILPRLVAGKELNTNSQAFESLKKLFNLRNKLVHYKTKKKRVCDIVAEDRVWESDAQNAIEAVNQAVRVLKEIDPEVDIDWLEDAKTDPYA